MEPLAIHPGVRKHGAHMFVMRYRAGNCGGLLIADFLKAVQAEGAPIRRAYDRTISQQPVIQRLVAKRPEFFRHTSTPVADQAAKEIIYVPHDVFLGTEANMFEIAAAIRKVQGKYKPRIALSKRAQLAEVSNNLAQLSCQRHSSRLSGRPYPVRHHWRGYHGRYTRKFWQSTRSSRLAA